MNLNNTMFTLMLIVIVCGTASAAQINVNQTGWWNAADDTVVPVKYKQQ